MKKSRFASIMLLMLATLPGMANAQFPSTMTVQGLATASATESGLVYILRDGATVYQSTFSAVADGRGIFNANLTQLSSTTFAGNGTYSLKFYIAGTTTTTPISVVPFAFRAATADNPAYGAAYLASTQSFTGQNTFRGEVTVSTDLWATGGNVFRKNLIINGNFDVWQRTTSSDSISDYAYAADRFQYRKAGSMVHTVSRSTNVPAPAQSTRLANFSFKADVTTADTSIAAGEYAFIDYKIEGYDWAHVAQRPFTLSFWVRDSSAGVHCVAFSNSGGNRSYVAEYGINAPNTWEKKMITVSASPSDGTWDYGNGVGLRIRFILAAGTNFHTTAGTWNTGDLLATSNQVNAVHSTSNDFYLSQVQLEKGGTASEFEFRPIQQELALAQRYFEMSYSYGTVPGTATGIGASIGQRGNGDSGWSACYRVTKRAAPTITGYSTSGASGKVRDDATASDQTFTVFDVGDSCYNFSTSVGSVGYSFRWQWIADAEL